MSTMTTLTEAGVVVNGQVQRSDTGRLVADAWEWLGAQYPYVELDEYVVMPNHLHGIIVIVDDPRRGDSRIAPTPSGTTPARQRKPLGRLIGAFKTVSTKQFNLACGVSGSRLWQRNYYERIVRDEDELERIREYVVNNPLQWELDEENPAKANAP